MSRNPRKDKLKVILRFAQLLSPEIDTTAEKVNATFDVLYDKRKHFQKYVRAKLKEELQSMIRMETCREIKKLYAPWHVLDIMDCSQQSLIFKPGKFCLSVSFITLCFFVLTFLLGMLQSNLWNTKIFPKMG
jgi:hypothetical protein